jgi:hypothetical protein
MITNSCESSIYELLAYNSNVITWQGGVHIYIPQWAIENVVWRYLSILWTSDNYGRFEHLFSLYVNTKLHKLIYRRLAWSPYSLVFNAAKSSWNPTWDAVSVSSSRRPNSLRVCEYNTQHSRYYLGSYSYRYRTQSVCQSAKIIVTERILVTSGQQYVHWQHTIEVTL